MPRRWVEQFCLDIQKYSNARVLFQCFFQPINMTVPSRTSSPGTITAGPLIQLPAQHASINVTLAHKTYSFDYNNPSSVCGIAQASRDTALLWGIFCEVVVGYHRWDMFVAKA